MAGMGDESIDMSKLGTALFAFGFVLVISLGIFTIGKSITNDGSDKVQKQLEVVQQSEFSDYDQQTVLGTKVKAAYQNFEGKPYAIIIATRAMIDATVSRASNIKGMESNISSSNGLDGKASSIVVTGVTALNSDGDEAQLWGVNYNALLEQNTLTLENGYYVTSGAFGTKAGAIAYYNKVSHMKKQGMGEYIPSGAKYQSTLIKDSTGQVVGIFFTQVSSNS